MDILAPPVMEELVALVQEVVRLVPQERVQWTEEQIVEEPIPQISVDSEQIVDVPVPQVDAIEPPSGKSYDFPRDSGEGLRRGIWQETVFFDFDT